MAHSLRRLATQLELPQSRNISVLQSLGNEAENIEFWSDSVALKTVRRIRMVEYWAIECACAPDAT